MTPSSLDLSETVCLIWSTQLELELEANPPGPGHIMPQRRDAMTGVVQISGGFTGALHLSCARQVVVNAAAKMFNRPENHISAEDLRDALGELTNMTAGNLKSRLPGSNSISLPTVVEGSDYEVTRLDSLIVAAAELQLNQQPIIVTLFRNRD